MKYRAGERRRAIEYEKSLTEWWKKNQTFEKSIENRPVDKSYVFYDGPPFITGNPHHGTLLSSIVKDAVPRYWTMRGYRVERKWGWDCHGLPAENFVEKQLGITDRRDIGTKWSLEDYIIKARESMVANSETWRSTIDRVGRWVDFDHCYRTMNKDFMESVWWAFKQLYEAGKIYEGRKVLMYDTKFATPVSKAEVTMDNDAYQTVTDPSAYVKFRITSGEFKNTFIEGGPEAGKPRCSAETPVATGVSDAPREGSILNSPTYFLAWTTTPWTLMANRALAVSADMNYGIYDIDGEKFILAIKRAEQIFPDHKPLKTIQGKNLAGLEYKSIDGHLCKVVAADFVGEEEGTGIVHIAPAYGEDDYELYKKHEDKISFVDVLDENGYYLPEYAEKLHDLGVRDIDDHGIQIWAANKFIAKCLEQQGIIYKIEYVQHEYPFNPRSKERIMYRAFPSWFFDVAGQKQMMLEENEHINWFPGYLKHGRFVKNIEAAPDWNLSRDRFWATAMPVWKSEQGTVLVIGSYEELEKYSGKRLDDYHRPWVDGIQFDAYVKDGKIVPLAENQNLRNCSSMHEDLARAAELPPEGHVREDSDSHLEHFTRIDKVLDCWFESGSMPFAQLHYPFENREKFEQNYPADFIVEYVGQIRAWFYYVHTVNTALAEIGAFGDRAKHGHKNAYKNVITTGTLAGNDGRKMSKSLGNYTDPNELMDQYSADALRFLLLSSPVLSGEDFALTDKDVSDTSRKLAMIWNVYDFFTTYAEIEDIDSEDLAKNTLSRSIFSDGANTERPSPVTTGAGERSEKDVFLPNPLDIWVISRLYELRNQITKNMNNYNIPAALEGVLPFIDDLSNWFVRRSRRRFSKNDDPSDKMQAFTTLYYALVYLAKLLAPFTPFLAEELYQNMTGLGSSVHLLDWPVSGEINHEVIDNMARTRQIITDALALRMQRSDCCEQIKIRQPLSRLTYTGDKLDDFYEQIIADEVNVKKVENAQEFTLDKTLTPELLEEGRAREIIRAVQSARKHAGLKQDDRIRLSLSITPPEKYLTLIKSETGATDLTKNQNYAHDEVAKINGENITISLEKI